MATTALAKPPDRGVPIRGPSAVAGDFRRALTLTVALAKNDFKLRFFGSVLGYLWQLMRPLLLFGVLFIMFTQIVSLSTTPNFGVALLLGIVLYTFFAEATGNAVGCVMVRENLVRKIHFPRLVIPMSVVMVACFNLALNLVVVVIFALVSGVTPTLSWLGLLPLLALLIVFAAGLAMLLSALYVRYRDVEPIWDVVLQVAFYASLILIPFEAVTAKSETLARLLVANPLAMVVQESRHLMIDPSYFSAGDAIGGASLLIVPVAIVIGTFALGL
ncbi:MAG: type transport system permease protein, partial [bacterium]